MCVHAHVTHQRGEGIRGGKGQSLPLPGGPAASLCTQNDNKMMEILRYTHQFLQKFCAGNPGNQALLHKHLQLFLTPGVRHAGPGPWWLPLWWAYLLSDALPSL